MSFALNLLRPMVVGSVGAISTTALHELARRNFSKAPRMDLAGMRALRRVLRRLRPWNPPKQKLFRWALVSELLGNAAFYSLTGVGNPRRPLLRGTLLGAAAGAGGVFLTPKLGLGRMPSQRAPRTMLMTAAWYLTGGLAAGVVQKVWEHLTETAPPPYEHEIFFD